MRTQHGALCTELRVTACSPSPHIAFHVGRGWIPDKTPPFPHVVPALFPGVKQASQPSARCSQTPPPFPISLTKTAASQEGKLLFQEKRSRLESEEGCARCPHRALSHIGERRGGEDVKIQVYSYTNLFVIGLIDFKGGEERTVTLLL